PAPTTRDTRCPLTVFSTSTSVAIAAIQNTFITPPTNNNVINTQQHPTHRAPCQTPSSKAQIRTIGADSRLQTTRSGRWGWYRRQSHGQSMHSAEPLGWLTEASWRPS